MDQLPTYTPEEIRRIREGMVEANQEARLARLKSGRKISVRKELKDLI